MREPGERIGGRFEVLGVLGEGGMATVYLAQDLHTGERLALKLLHPHLSKRPSMRARLRREVDAAARLSHPNILVADEMLDLDGGLGLRMPLHTGRSLADVVAAEGPLPEAALWRLGASLSSALTHAHRAGVIHRDITPDNILIDDRGEAVLVDFGLARLDSQRTAAGTEIAATAGYAAPEVYEGARAEPRMDLYALGAVLAFAATGKAPFGSGSPMQVLKRQHDGTRTPLHRARRDLPLPWCEIVEGMLAPKPAQRPQGAAAVSRAFSERAAPPKPSASTLASLPAASPLQLAEGDWVVRIQEQDGDARRRGRLRREREGAADIETVVVGALAQAGRKLMSAFSLPPPKSPEERIVSAVARAAGLPDDALDAPPALLDRDVVLLSGVDEQTARDVGRTAQHAGFLVELAQVPPDLRRTPQYVAAVLAGFMAVGMGAGLLLSGWGAGLLSVALIGLLLLWRGVPQRPPLPEAAFDRELLEHLTPRYRIEAPEAAPAPAEEALSPVQSVQRRALAQISELEALIEASAVAEVVAHDLRETLSALRWQAEELGNQAVILLSVQSSGASESAAAGVAQVESRLERLQTLAQAGEDVSMREVRRLEAALTTHQEALREQDEVEAELTRVAARFLEIGATVAHSRRVLTAAAAPSREEGDALLGQLRAEVSRAAQAQDELSDLQRRRKGWAQRGREKQ